MGHIYAYIILWLYIVGENYIHFRETIGKVKDMNQKYKKMFSCLFLFELFTNTQLSNYVQGFQRPW